MNNDVSSSKFWDECYINDNTGWDIGSVTPVFEDWCNKLQQKHSILVPGAGNGYDPLYFSSKGHDVTAVDFSKEATNNMKAYAEKNQIDINIINADIFKLDINLFNKFDYIIEYTCFCAIDRNRRLDYIKVMSDLLKKNGELIGLFLPVLKDKKDGGPPYSINIEEVISQFSDHFDLVELKKHKLSINARVDNERYIHFKKK